MTSSPRVITPLPSPDRVERSPHTPPQIAAPPTLVVDEREVMALTVGVYDLDADDAPSSAGLRVFARGLPPGARWDEGARTLHFRPDFIQGGTTWEVTFVADDGEAQAQATTTIEIRDTVAPPWPRVEHQESARGYTRLWLSQVTDDFLDAPHEAGRRFPAIVSRPDAIPEGQRLPVLILLHGFMEGPRLTGASDAFVISPADPDSTYWWGYATGSAGRSAEGPADGPADGRPPVVPPYTQRRVLHLLEWVLAHEPAADPERVFVAGRSMGGTGAATLGLLRARHFAGVDAWLWQAIPRNHRPLRITQLTAHWGAPERDLGDGEPDGLGAWDRMDLTRVLLQEPLARNQWLFSRHGKDDAVIHFGAAVLPSPLTGVSLYEALQDTGTGHLVVWDEGGHGGWDPVLGARWWDDGWDPRTDETTFLRRDLAFVGFSNASHDDDPGGGGNDTRPWHDHMGYAGVISRPGDTGWAGDRAGMLGGHLRWDAGALVDEIDRFEVSLRGSEAHEGPWPITADVTLRRVQSFACRPGEGVDWSFGEVSGEAVADEHGELTIADVPITAQWQTLVVVRRW